MRQISVSSRGILMFVFLSLTLASGRSVSEEDSRFSFEDFKRFKQLQIIKIRILKGLNLDEPPTATGKRGNSITNNSTAKHPGYILEDPIILFSEPAVSKSYKNSNDVISFQLNTTGNRSAVRSVNLFLRMKEKPTKSRTKEKRRGKGKKKGKRSKDNRKRKTRHRRRGRQIKVIVHQLENATSRKHRLAVQKVRIKKIKWLNVKLNPDVIQRALETKQNTLLLKISCKRCRKRVRVDLVHDKAGKKRHSQPRSFSGQLNNNRPFLVLRTSSGSSVEKLRREMGECPPPIFPSSSPFSSSHASPQNRSFSQPSMPCCRRRMYVDFAELGWAHWILYPPGFSTVLCQGLCEATHTSPDNRNHETSRDLLPINRSCVSTETVPLTVAFYKRNNVVAAQTIPGVIDRRCGCV